MFVKSVGELGVCRRDDVEGDLTPYHGTRVSVAGRVSNFTPAAPVTMPIHSFSRVYKCMRTSV